MSRRRPTQTARKYTMKFDDDSDESEGTHSTSSSHRRTKITASNEQNNKNSNSNKNKPDLNLITKLESITGLSRNEAIQLLEACGNDINMAINIQLGGDFIPINEATASKNSLNGTSKKSDVASNIIQEDDVRPPIPQKIEKLIDYDPYAVARPTKRARTVFDGFRDLQQEFDESDDGASKSKKRNTLAQLFRPPIDILFSGSFDAAKRLGTRANRWILLNIQNTEEFECQCLNRDLWSEQTVKDIIRANFIFIQIYHDTNEGLKLINYYNVHKFPYVAVIDPRTGEKIAQWSKLDKTLFCELVTNFLSDHEPPIDSVNDDLGEIKNGHSNKFSTNYDDDDDDTDHNVNKNGKEFSEKLPNLKYLSFSDRFDKDESKKVISPKKMNSKKASEELLKPSLVTNEINGKKTTAIVDTSSDEDDIKPLKIVNNNNNNKKDKSVDSSNKNNSQMNEIKSTNEVIQTVNETKQIRYETDTVKKDCHLRIMFPNADRLDFITDGDSNLKLLIDYLRTKGYSKPRYELIERTFTLTNSASSSDTLNQARNLFVIDSKSTFKQLNLYPRVFLLVQDTS